MKRILLITILGLILIIPQKITAQDQISPAERARLEETLRLIEAALLKKDIGGCTKYDDNGTPLLGYRGTLEALGLEHYTCDVKKCFFQPFPLPLRCEDYGIFLYPRHQFTLEQAEEDCKQQMQYMCGGTPK